MVKKNTTAAAKPSNAAEAARQAVANQPRQSHVAFADYVNTLVQHAPDQLADIVDPATVKAVQGAIKEAGDRYTSTVATQIQRAIDTKVAAATAALTKEDPLTGYVGFAFDPEVFAKKTAPKTGRRKLSPEEKANKVVEQATPEQLAALAALLQERGISISE